MKTTKELKEIIKNAKDQKYFFTLDTESQKESGYINNPHYLSSISDLKEIVELRERIAKLTKALRSQTNRVKLLEPLLCDSEQPTIKKLSFKEYETIVDINNHNYGRYEALIDGGYINGELLNEGGAK